MFTHSLNTVLYFPMRSLYFAYVGFMTINKKAQVFFSDLFGLPLELDDDDDDKGADGNKGSDETGDAAVHANDVALTIESESGRHTTDIPVDALVRTPFGKGTLQSVRPAGQASTTIEVAVVELSFGTAYLRKDAIEEVNPRRLSIGIEQAIERASFVSRSPEVTRNGMRDAAFNVPSTFRAGILKMMVSDKSINETIGVHCVSVIKGDVKDTFDAVSGESGKIRKQEVRWN